jgi:hypothetical protein
MLSIQEKIMMLSCAPCKRLVFMSLLDWLLIVPIVPFNGKIHPRVIHRN